MSAPNLMKAAAFLMLLLAGLSGCAVDSRGQSLEDTLELYGRAVRWGDLRGAAQFLHPEQRANHRQLEFELQRFEQVTVTGYQVLSRVPGPEPESIRQAVEIGLANRHTAIGRTIRDVQTWRWDEEHKRWWLTSGLPELGRR